MHKSCIYATITMEINLAFNSLTFSSSQSVEPQIALCVACFSGVNNYIRQGTESTQGGRTRSFHS